MACRPLTWPAGLTGAAAALAVAAGFAGFKARAMAETGAARAFKSRLHSRVEGCEATNSGCSRFSKAKISAARIQVPGARLSNVYCPSSFVVVDSLVVPAVAVTVTPGSGWSQKWTTPLWRTASSGLACASRKSKATWREFNDRLLTRCFSTSLYLSLEFAARRRFHCPHAAL